MDATVFFHHIHPFLKLIYQSNRGGVVGRCVHVIVSVLSTATASALGMKVLLNVNEEVARQGVQWVWFGAVLMRTGTHAICLPFTHNRVSIEVGELLFCCEHDKERWKLSMIWQVLGNHLMRKFKEFGVVCHLR